MYTVTTTQEKVSALGPIVGSKLIGFGLSELKYNTNPEGLGPLS